MLNRLATPSGAGATEAPDQSFTRSPSVSEGDTRLVAGVSFQPPTTAPAARLPCCIGCGLGKQRPPGSPTLCINPNCGRKAWAHSNCLGAINQAKLSRKEKERLPLAFASAEEVPEALEAWNVFEGRMSILMTLASHYGIGVDCADAVFTDIEGQELRDLLPKCLIHNIPNQDDMTMQLFLTAIHNNRLQFACSHDCSVEARWHLQQRDAAIAAQGLRPVQPSLHEVRRPSTEVSAAVAAGPIRPPRVGDLPLASFLDLESQDKDLNALLEEAQLDDTRWGQGEKAFARPSSPRPASEGVRLFLTVMEDANISEPARLSVVEKLLQGEHHSQVLDCFRAGGWAGANFGFEGEPVWDEILTRLRRVEGARVGPVRSTDIIPVSSGGGTFGVPLQGEIRQPVSMVGETSDPRVATLMDLDPGLAALLEAKGALHLGPMLKQQHIFDLATLHACGSKEEFAAGAGSLPVGIRCNIMSLLPSRAQVPDAVLPAPPVAVVTPSKSKGEAMAAGDLPDSWQAVLRHSSASSRTLPPPRTDKRVGAGMYGFWKSHAPAELGGAMAPVKPPVSIMQEFFRLELATTASLTGTVTGCNILFSGVHTSDVEHEWARQVNSKWWGEVSGADAQMTVEGHKLKVRTTLVGKVVLLRSFDRAQLEYWFLFWEMRLIEMEQCHLIPILTWLKLASLPRDLADMGGGDGLLMADSTIISDGEADLEHSDRVHTLGVFRQAAMHIQFGNMGNKHPLDAKARHQLASVRLVIAGRQSTAASAMKTVTYRITSKPANLSPEEMWNDKVCFNCGALNSHMGMVCQAPRKPNLLCCICLAGCHAECECSGPPDHALPQSYFIERRLSAMQRAGQKQGRAPGTK